MRLGDICTKIGSGATPRGGKESYKSSGIPIIRSQNVLDWSFKNDALAFIDGKQAGALSNVEVLPGDVLLNITGDSVARACIVPVEQTPARVNQHVAIVRHGDRLNPTYLLAFLQNIKPHLLSLASSGATRKALTKSMIENLEIELPDIETQNRISSVINSVQQKIMLNIRLNGYLLQLTKIQLKDYLSRAKDTPLVSVGDYVGSMSNGATPSRKNAAFWDDGNIPWVKTGEVNNGLILKTEEHVTRLALEKTSIKLLPVDTVIMALYGSGTAGRLGILQIEATTNQACTAMVCKSSIEAFYLFVTLQGMYRQIDNMTRGSVQQNLSKDLVAEIQIPRIPKQVLEEMGLAEYYAQIAVNMRESDRLASIRDALLPKLMSGEIDVSQIELPTPPNSHLSAGL